MDLTIPEIANSERAIQFIRESFVKSEECNTCRWLRLCRGGCRRDCQNNLTGKIEKNCYCEAYKDFLDYAYPRIKKLAEHFMGK